MPVVELVCLAALWGASFLFMRIAVADFGPLALIAVRVVVATLVLMPVMLKRDVRRDLRLHLRGLLVVGLTNSALPFSLIAYSMLALNAGIDSVLNATTPLFATVLGALWFGQPLDRSRVVGLLVGLAGVAVLSWDVLHHGPLGAPEAIAAMLLAALCYGFAANYSKRAMAGVRPLTVAFGSQLCASVLMLPLAALSWPARAPHGTSIAAALALGILCTGLAYLLYFRLIENASATFATSVTFIVPIFGILWGAVFLKETLTAPMLGGAAVILLGTLFASGRVRLSTRPPPKP